MKRAVDFSKRDRGSYENNQKVPMINEAKIGSFFVSLKTVHKWMQIWGESLYLLTQKKMHSSHFYCQ